MDGENIVPGDMAEQLINIAAQRLLKEAPAFIPAEGLYDEFCARFPYAETDDQLRAIAGNGGLVGIGYWDGAVCEMTVPSIVRAIRHAVSVMGVQHVALGSDFDGATTVPWDTRALGLVTDGLLQNGFSPEDVRRIMGGNVLGFLGRQLPEGGKP